MNSTRSLQDRYTSYSLSRRRGWVSGSWLFRNRVFYCVWFTPYPVFCVLFILEWLSALNFFWLAFVLIQDFFAIIILIFLIFFFKFDLISYIYIFFCFPFYFLTAFFSEWTWLVILYTNNSPLFLSVHQLEPNCSLFLKVPSRFGLFVNLILSTICRPFLSASSTFSYHWHIFFLLIYIFFSAIRAAEFCCRHPTHRISICTEQLSSHYTSFFKLHKLTYRVFILERTKIVNNSDSLEPSKLYFIEFPEFFNHWSGYQWRENSLAPTTEKHYQNEYHSYGN